LPLLRGEPTEPSQPFTIPGMRHNTTRYYRPWVTTRGNVNIVIRHGHWKGVYNVEPGTFELYDLIMDPSEQRDIQTEHAELVQGMRAYATDWYQSCQGRATATEPVGELDEDTRRKLRSIGYVE